MPGYLVPKERCRVETRAGNSRFIATVARAATVKEAQAFIRDIRGEMPDATHHVYAYRVGHGASVSEGMSDDGEPAGTSGPPAMAVLRGSGIGDVALVITRYFGGTKLGTGGLVAAYTVAAQAAFAALVTEEKIRRVRCRIELPYAALNAVRQILDEAAARIEDESFGATITLVAALPADQRTAIERRLRDASSGQVRAVPLDPEDASSS